MNFETKGTYSANVTVNITNNDVIHFLQEMLKIPAVDSKNESEDISYYIKRNELGIAVSIEKKVIYYRNYGRGEEKYDHEKIQTLTSDEDKVRLFEAYLLIKNALKVNKTVL